VSEKDIDIRLEDDVLVIRADKKFERKEEQENYHFMERSLRHVPARSSTARPHRSRPGSGEL
jgi:HSP20 family molecular chaperone IbpA